MDNKEKSWGGKRSGAGRPAGTTGPYKADELKRMVVS